MKMKCSIKVWKNERSIVRSVITRRDKVHAYRAKIQSRFSQKQSLERKIFILYFRLLFSHRITPFPLVSPVTNHPVCKTSKYSLLISSTRFNNVFCLRWNNKCEWFVEINEDLLWYVAINSYQGTTMVTRDHQ